MSFIDMFNTGILIEEIDSLIQECDALLAEDFIPAKNGLISEGVACDAAKEGIKYQKEQLKAYKDDAKACKAKDSTESKANCLQTVSDKIDSSKEQITKHKTNKKTRCLGSKLLRGAGSLLLKGAKKLIGK